MAPSPAATQEGRSPTRELLGLLARRRTVVAGVLCGVSVISWALVLPTYLRKGMVDLDVYRATAPGIFDGTLYSLREATTGLPFTYPPFAAIPLSLLSVPSLDVSELLTMIVSIAAFARVCFLLGGLIGRSRDAGGSTWFWTFVLVGSLVWAEPFNTVLRAGQINLVLVWLVCEDLFGRWPSRFRGVLVGVATGIKLTPGLMILTLVAIGRRRDALRAAAAFAVTIVIGAVVAPSSSWTFWTDVGSTTGVGDLAYAANQSMSGPLVRTFGDPTGWRVHLVLAAALVVMVLLLARRLERLGDVAGTWSVAALGMLLVSPVSWTHHYVWILIPMAGLLADRRHRVTGPALFAGAAAMLLWAPMWQLPYGYGREQVWQGVDLLLGNSFTAMALLMLAWFGYRAWGVRVEQDQRVAVPST